MSDAPHEPAGAGADSSAPGESAAAVPEVRKRPRGARRAFARRWIKRGVVIVSALIASVVITLISVDIGNISVGGRSLRTVAESRGTSFLKRPLHIGRIRALITPGKFAFEDVTIEGPTKEDRPFFYAKKITVDIPWWALLRSPRELYLEVRLFDWRMVVENWATGGARLPNLKTQGGGGGPSQLRVRSLAVYAQDGEFIFDDHVSNWGVICRNLEFALVRANNLGTLVGTAKFTNGTTRIQNFVPMRTDFSTRFQLQGSRVQLHHIDLVTDGAKSHVSGYVNFGNWPEQEYAVSSDVDFARMREIFFANAEWRLSGEGKFTGMFKFSKTGRNLSGQFESEEAGLGVRNQEWRFPHLHGALEWTPTRFAVTHAESAFLGGSMRLNYGFPLGRPNPTATLAVDYQDVDVYRFTRQWGFTALEPDGRMQGTVTMSWPNGRFTAAMQGAGETIITPPEGAPVAAATLPAGAPRNPPVPRLGFVKFRPYGHFALAGETKYTFTAASLDFEPSWVSTPSTFVTFSGHARGGPVNVPFHVTSSDWQSSDRLFAAIMTNFSSQMGAIPVGGRGTFDGALTGAFNAPRIEGRFSGDQIYAWDVDWGAASGQIVIENGYMHLTDGLITHASGGRVLTSGKYALGYPRADGGEEIHADVRLENVPLDPLKTAFELDDWPVTGTVQSATLHLEGKYELLDDGGKPGTMRLVNGTAWEEPFDSVTSELDFKGDGSLDLNGMRMEKAGAEITGVASIDWEQSTYSFSARTEGTGVPVEALASFRLERAPLSGQLTFTAEGRSSFDSPRWTVNAQIADLYAGGEGVGAVAGRLELANEALKIDLDVQSVNRLQVRGSGEIAMNDAYDATLNLRFTDTSIDPFLKFVAQDMPYTKAIVGGSVSIAGPLATPERLTVTAVVDKANLTLFAYPLENDGDIRLAFKDNIFRFERVRLKGEGTALEISGGVDAGARTANVHANGQARLEALQAFYADLRSEGGASLTAALTGPFDKLVVRGSADITDGVLGLPALPHAFRRINGRIVMEEGRVSVDKLRATMGEGPVTFAGAILLDGYRPTEYNLQAHGRSMQLRILEGLRTTVDADLSLRGPITTPELAGQVDVLRASYAPRVRTQAGYFDLLSGVGETAPEPIEVFAPEAPSAIPVKLDIQVRSRVLPFIQSNAATIYGSADVDITGTVSQPIVTGSVLLDRGEWVFSGNRYRLTGGLIDFSNPVQFDPFFDISATTRARSTGQSYDVSLRVSGTLTTLTPSISSEPWLPEFQIISLLFGESPAVGRAELLARGDPRQIQLDALRTAGFAFLTSPISATVGSVAERLTAIDTVQIVPLLGNQADLQQLNPMARITLGMRLSERVYLTYARTLTSTSTLQNEIILIEFDQNDQVSWILSRNEDRSFALDFRIKYVFK